MAIQTAGEQRYYDFIEEKAKSLRTGMIVWISFLAAALIIVFNNIFVGAVLAAAGAVLGVRNMKGQKELESKLSGIQDRTGFFNQLIAPETADLPVCGLIVTREYVLSCRKDIFISPLSRIERMEIQTEGKKKVCILIVRGGGSHEVADSEECKEEDFLRACEAVRSRLEAAQEKG